MNKFFLLENDVESLSKAIYAITSWFPNRRFLGIVDKINRDFINFATEILGNMKVNSYKKFMEFYNKVVAYYVLEFPKEDFPVDLGSVRFFSNDRFYNNK